MDRACTASYCIRAVDQRSYVYKLLNLVRWIGMSALSGGRGRSNESGYAEITDRWIILNGLVSKLNGRRGRVRLHPESQSIVLLLRLSELFHQSSDLRPQPRLRRRPALLPPTRNSPESPTPSSTKAALPRNCPRRLRRRKVRPLSFSSSRFWDGKWFGRTIKGEIKGKWGDGGVLGS
jgi:hypothetical protein